MKNLISVTLIVLLLAKSQSASSFTGEKYDYTVNLAKVVDDKVQVSLSTPAISTASTVFYMPKIVPGTYTESNYGRFITGLNALDKNGHALPIAQLDQNSWKIDQAETMVKIIYWVDDTFDADLEEDEIYNFNGTNIESDKVFVINTGGFFGYFENLQNIPFYIKVIHPDGFYGSTGLIPVKTDGKPDKEPDFKKLPKNAQVDFFEVENYNKLIDSPLMYNRPDTSIVHIGNTEVLISVYSPGKKVHSKFVAENIRELLNAQKDYLGGKLPVEKYAFLFYFEDLRKVGEYQGALEHNYSSFYYLPDVSQESLIQTLIDIAAHEFFHVLAPLSIHSEEIEYFDFNNPKMSEHLWLYEGVTEYFSGHVQLKYGMVTPEDYLEMIRLKIANSKSEYNDTLPFTDLSKYTIDRYPDQYDNVYQKGALIGLCLDIKLRYLSDGKYGLQDLMLDLAKKYGKEKPFKDNELFPAIQELTYPEIGEFLDTYVGGHTSLPLEEIFSLIGVSYTPYRETRTFTFGGFGISLDGNNLIIDDVSNLDPFGYDLGYRKDDQLLKFQGKPIPENPYEINRYLENILDSMREGEDFTVTVLRNNERGKKSEVTLTAKARKLPAYEMYLLEIKTHPSEEQKKLLQAWMNPQKS